MVKRKAGQALDTQVEQQPTRRSRRNVANDETTVVKSSSIKSLPVKNLTTVQSPVKASAKTSIVKSSTTTNLATKSAKTTTKSAKTQLAKQFSRPDETKQIEIGTKTSTRSTKRTSIRTTKQAIVNEFNDLNKEVIPIRTYGKATKNSTNDQKDNTIKPALKSIKKPTVQLKKKGNLTISSPIDKTNVLPAKSTVQQTISTIEQGGQQKIIINKILMPPDAYNQIIKQQQATSNQKMTSPSLPATQAVIKNLFSSGVKVLNVPSLGVTNPSSMLTTNVLPNIRLVSSPSNQQQIKQIQLPIIIKSIMNPQALQVPNLQQQTTINTQTKTTNIKVNPITSVKPVLLTNGNRTPEKKSPAVTPIPAAATKLVSSPTNKPARKTRVSFNFERNTSTNIKPISNDLPLTASTVLMTSTPKQSIIKKPKVFDLPCTPIVNNVNSRRTIGKGLVITNRIDNTKPVVTVAAPISQQIKSKLDAVQNSSAQNSSSTANKSGDKLRIKCCRQNECNCLSSIPKSDLDEVKQTYKNLNAPKKMLYIYCSTIRVNESAKFDFLKYAFFIKTSNGYVQVCHRVFMEIFDRQNLQFVEAAFKKIDA